MTNDMIRRFVTTNFYVPDTFPLEDTTSFLDQGIIDSTGVLEIVSFIEREFDVTVRDIEMIPENFDSIALIAAFIERKRRVSRAPEVVACPQPTAAE